MGSARMFATEPGATVQGERPASKPKLLTALQDMMVWDWECT